MNTTKALRVADTILAFKIVTLSLVVLMTLIGVAVGVGTDATYAFIAFAGGVCWFGATYVTFGWLEHTIRLLVSIAENTYTDPNIWPGAAPVAVAPTP